MTEAEWLAATDPQQMLEFVRETASDRKLRLLACGCCRLTLNALADARSGRALEAAERYADGYIGEAELAGAASAAYDAYREAKVAEGYDADSDVHPEYAGHLHFVAHATTREVDLAADWAISLQWGSDDERCDLLRCVFGNPFRPIPTVPTAWLTYDGGTARKLAEDAYTERQLPTGTLEVGRLAVLADALEDAGCADSELITHLRGPGTHVRGCWALDLLLVKS
jgi:hypothetical protein